jgi:signal transduction histidine kinase
LHTYKLLENLLDWANSQRGKIQFNPEKIDIKELFQQKIENLSEFTLKKNIKIECRVPENCSAFADRNMLKCILRNLIGNAVKFSYCSGTIYLDVEISDKNLQISVIDNGIGIQPEIKEKIFSSGEFFSTSGTENEKGTGIGLILCKEFVERHGGKIWVESEEESGSRFSFTIPKFQGGHHDFSADVVENQTA